MAVKHWPALVLGLAMALALAFAHELGHWHGQMVRYDDCQLTRFGSLVFYACPVRVPAGSNDEKEVRS